MYQVWKKAIITFALFSLAAFAAACDKSSAGANTQPARKNPPPVIDSGKPKIVAFGDSLTAGFGLTEKDSYPYLLQEKIKADGYDYEVVNAGVSGDTSRGGLERIDWSLEQPNVRILVLELGANDMLRGLSVQQMKKNVGEIIKKAKAKNITVLLCGLFPPDMPIVTKAQNEFAVAFRDLAKENQVEFLPFLLENVGGVKGLNQADGIHPNADGEKIMTDTVYKALKPLLK